MLECLKQNKEAHEHTKSPIEMKKKKQLFIIITVRSCIILWSELRLMITLTSLVMKAMRVLMLMLI